MTKRLRINQHIDADEVRLIGAEGEQLGIKTIEEALALAKEASLDLAEVAPNSKPPVCKILDYGKYQYHQKKVEQRHRRQQKQNEVKGIRIGFRTDNHDVQVKANQARKFLGARHHVKVTLVFRGRESQHFDLAQEKMNKFAEQLGDVSTVETAPKRQGNTLFMMLAPLK